MRISRYKNLVTYQEYIVRRVRKKKRKRNMQKRAMSSACLQLVIPAISTTVKSTRLPAAPPFNRATRAQKTSGDTIKRHLVIPSLTFELIRPIIGILMRTLIFHVNRTLRSFSFSFFFPPSLSRASKRRERERERRDTVKTVGRQRAGHQLVLDHRQPL